MKLTSRLSPVQRKSWKIHRIEGEADNSPARQLQKAHNQLHINNCTQKDKIEARNVSMFTDYQKNTYISPLKSTRGIGRTIDFNESGSIMDRHRSVALRDKNASHAGGVQTPSQVMSGTINLRKRAFSPEMGSLIDMPKRTGKITLKDNFNTERKGQASMMVERNNAGSTLTKPVVFPALSAE